MSQEPTLSPRRSARPRKPVVLENYNGEIFQLVTPNVTISEPSWLKGRGRRAPKKQPRQVSGSAGPSTSAPAAPRRGGEVKPRGPKRAKKASMTMTFPNGLEATGETNSGTFKGVIGIKAENYKVSGNFDVRIQKRQTNAVENQPEEEHGDEAGGIMGDDEDGGSQTGEGDGRSRGTCSIV